MIRYKETCTRRFRQSKNDMAERRRRIAQEDRERIVRAFEEPEQDYLVVADTLGVNRSTARGIVARFIRENRVDERPRGVRNNVKVNEEMRQCLEAILEENPMLTLEAINRKLREEPPDRPHVHVRTVAKHLDGMLYTLKLAHTIPADRNRADVIQRRNEYAHWFLEEANLNHTVFIDECGFNIWTSRSLQGVRDKATELTVRCVGRKEGTLQYVWQYLQCLG